MDNAALPVARYQVDIELNDNLSLQEYAGSMLRGGFGHALKGVSCVTRTPTCDGCPLRSGCAYSLVFQPVAPKEIALKRYTTTPVPYTVEPMGWGRQRLTAGERFSFRMVLMGPAIASLSLIILAWQRAWQRGFGPSKAKGEVMAINWQQPDGTWQEVFSREQPIIQPHDASIRLPETPVPQQVRLNLITPMRLEVNKCPVGPDRFLLALLATNLQRRVKLLQQFYFEEAEFAQDQISQEDIVSGVMMNTNLGWRDWTRYSNRQHRKMNLGGVVGSIVLSGELNALWPYLQLGEWLHVGAKTSFGFGRYTLGVPESDVGAIRATA